MKEKFDWRNCGLPWRHAGFHGAVETRDGMPVAICNYCDAENPKSRITFEERDSVADFLVAVSEIGKSGVPVAVEISLAVREGVPFRSWDDFHELRFLAESAFHDSHWKVGDRTDSLDCGRRRIAFFGSGDGMSAMRERQAFVVAFGPKRLLGMMERLWNG